VKDGGKQPAVDPADRVKRLAEETLRAREDTSPPKSPEDKEKVRARCERLRRELSG